MYYRTQLIEQAYQLAWQQAALGMRTADELAEVIAREGIPPALARNVADQVSPPRYPRQSRQERDLFQFGLFLLSIGGMVAFTTLVLSSTPFVLPIVFISGMAIVWGGVIGRPRSRMGGGRLRSLPGQG